MIIVYITEAHAADVWNIGESAGTLNYSHKKLEDRVQCAEKFKKTFDITIPMYVDNMDNEFETKFASWPFRYFVTRGKKLVKIGMPQDSEFEFGELLEFLEKEESAQ